MLSATLAVELIFRKDFSFLGNIQELLFLFHFVFLFLIGYVKVDDSCVILAWYMLQKWVMFLQKLTSVRPA